MLVPVCLCTLEVATNDCKLLWYSHCYQNTFKNRVDRGRVRFNTYWYSPYCELLATSILHVHGGAETLGAKAHVCTIVVTFHHDCITSISQFTLLLHALFVQHLPIQHDLEEHTSAVTRRSN